MLDKLCVIGSDPTRKPRYQNVEDCTCWPVVGSFNNWKIVQFTNKTTTNEDFNALHKVVVYGISDNMSSLVQNRKYDAINIVNPTTIGYYVVKLLSKTYMLQYDKKLTS